MPARSQAIAVTLPLAGGFRFGDWAVAPGENTVRQGDRKVRLEPKVMRLLLARDVLDANGAGSFVLSRFNNDIIDSRSFRDQQLWRWTGGFDGNFHIGNRRFSWEAFAVHGESDIRTQSEGIIDG